jgi:hypothetical protein
MIQTQYRSFKMLLTIILDIVMALGAAILGIIIGLTGFLALYGCLRLACATAKWIYGDTISDISF